MVYYLNNMFEDILFGILNGITAWPLLILHVFSVFTEYPVYDIVRNTPWYQVGFLMGAGSPILGFIRSR